MSFLPGNNLPERPAASSGAEQRPVQGLSTNNTTDCDMQGSAKAAQQLLLYYYFIIYYHNYYLVCIVAVTIIVKLN